MKATTIKKRLDAKYNGSKNAQAYRIVTDLINETPKTYRIYGNVIRPCYTSGSGRFTSNMNHTSEVARILDLIGVKYTQGNDSPRGGECGAWIKILTKIDK